MYRLFEGDVYSGFLIQASTRWKKKPKKEEEKKRKKKNRMKKFSSRKIWKFFLEYFSRINCLLRLMRHACSGGLIANSLALQTDAAHLASDLIAFLVSLFALWASGKPATKKMSFGFHRIEVNDHH